MKRNHKCVFKTLIPHNIVTNLKEQKRQFFSFFLRTDCVL